MVWGPIANKFPIENLLDGVGCQHGLDGLDGLEANCKHIGNRRSNGRPGRFGLLGRLGDKLQTYVQQKIHWMVWGTIATTCAIENQNDGLECLDGSEANCAQICNKQSNRRLGRREHKLPTHS